MSLAVYVLYIVDVSYEGHWEKLDDYLYYVRSAGAIIQSLCGFIMLGTGAQAMMSNLGQIYAPMMCLRAFSKTCLQVKKGWNTVIKRRTGLEKIKFLPEIRQNQLKHIDDVCSICYQQFVTSARITPCQHYFHAQCLIKWLCIRNTCPLCQQIVKVRSWDKAAFDAAPQDAHVQ